MDKPTTTVTTRRTNWTGEELPFKKHLAVHLTVQHGYTRTYGLLFHLTVRIRALDPLSDPGGKKVN